MDNIKKANLMTRQEQAAVSRQILLESAKALFAEHGYHATPIRAINQKANMAQGILYHYFPQGKRELLTVLLKESFDKWEQEFKQADSDLDNMALDEALARIYILCNNLFISDIDLMRILFRESEVLDLDEAALMSTLIEQRLQLFSGFLKRRYERNEIRHMNFDIAAKQFMSIIFQSFVSKMTGIDFLSGSDMDQLKKDVIQHTQELWKI